MNKRTILAIALTAFAVMLGNTLIARAQGRDTLLDRAVEYYLLAHLGEAQDVPQDVSLGAIGTLPAENYLPYVTFNDGYYSTKDITTTGTLTGATLSLSGAATLSSSLTVGTTLTISDGQLTQTYDVGTSTPPTMLSMTYTDDSGLIVADGYDVTVLALSTEDDSGSATSTWSIIQDFTETGSTTLQTALGFYPKLDSTYTVASIPVLQLDGGGTRGQVAIATSTPNYPLDVDGDVNVGESGQTNAFRIDATNAYIGVGTSTPWATLSLGAGGGSATTTQDVGKSCYHAYSDTGSEFWWWFSGSTGSGLDIATSTSACNDS